MTNLSITQQQYLFGWFSFSLTVPNTYLLLGLPLLMRQHGWSGTEIGLFQLIAIPAVFKFVLAIPIQYCSFGQKHYRNWLLLLMVLLILSIGLLATNNWLHQPIWLFILAFITLFFITWIDIPLNALLVKLVPREQQLNAGSIRAISLFLGAIFGSGIMLVVQYHCGWSLPFIIMGGNLLLSLIAIALLSEAPTTIAKKISLNSHQIIYDWKTFFKQSGSLPWITLLLTCFPIISAIWLYQKPFLIDQGMEADQVAWIIGVGGGIVGSLFSCISRQLNRYLTIGKILPLCLGWTIIALISLLLIISLSLSVIWLMIGLFLIASSMGMVSTLFLGLMFNFTRQSKRASDYGLQASLFVMARMLLPILAGILLDLGGYILMLSVFLLVMLILFVLSFRYACYLSMQKQRVMMIDDKI